MIFAALLGKIVSVVCTLVQ